MACCSLALSACTAGGVSTLPPPKGQHGLRAVARGQCLRQAAATCKDVEGILEADAHASSHPVFVRWRASLSDFDKVLLSALGQSRLPPVSCATLLVLIVRPPTPPCATFGPLARDTVAHREYRIPHAWYLAQPRCTSKSCWITFPSARSEARRAELQVLSCKLALHILQDTWCTLRHAPHDHLIP